MLIFPKHYEKGYTYFGVLFVVILISLALSGASLVWHFQAQRQKEQQLIYIGNQYIKAIASYYQSSPGGVKQYPKSIAELLKDSRYPLVKRHLRKPLLDPFTLKNDWGLIRTKQGKIAGIFSQAEGEPIKKANFENSTLDKFLSGKSKYQQWKFVYIATTEVNSISNNEEGVGSIEEEQENTDEDTGENLDENEPEQEEGQEEEDEVSNEEGVNNFV